MGGRGSGRPSTICGHDVPKSKCRPCCAAYQRNYATNVRRTCCPKCGGAYDMTGKQRRCLACHPPAPPKTPTATKPAPTHCRNGHPRTPENFRKLSKGQKYPRCYPCHHAAVYRWNAANPEKVKVSAKAASKRWYDFWRNRKK